MAAAAEPVGVRLVASELDEVDLGMGNLAFELTMLLSRLVDVADLMVKDIGLNFLVLASPRLAKLRLVRAPIPPSCLPLAMLLREEETSLKSRLLDAFILASLLLIISFIISRL